METSREKNRLSPSREEEHGGYERRGLGPWIGRNPWLLVRLSIAFIFVFCSYLAAVNLSYGLQDDPVVITPEQVNRGALPSNLENGDYVELRGTPVLGEDVARGRFGTPESKVAVASRYGSANYFYFQLEETGDKLLVQQAQVPPTPEESSRVFRGRLATVGTVIFHATTQQGLKQTGLPRDASITVIESSDTPAFYRQFTPVYLLIIALGPLSVGYLVWRKNKPFLD